MTPMLDLWCCCTHPWGTVLSFLSFFFFTFFSLLLSLCHYYWSISRFTDSPFVISILWLSPSVNLLFQIFYFSVLELPFVSVHKFCFSAETSYTFIHCEYIFIVLIVTLKTSSTNSNIWIISESFLLRMVIFSYFYICWINLGGILYSMDAVVWRVWFLLYFVCLNRQQTWLDSDWSHLLAAV